MSRISRLLLPPILLIADCGCAEAHSFGTIYNLPIPFWMYAFAASATLALSFVMVGFFVTARNAQRNFRSVEIPDALPRAGWSILRGLSVLLLLMTMMTGLFGAQRPFNNFSLTFFWISFVLGFAYLTALIGDIYEFINPWRVLCDLIGRLRPTAFDGRMRYPAWLAYYPALALYMGFIWLELFGHTTPRSLGLVLLGYSILNLAAAALFGAESWFRYGEFFAVFFRLLGKIAPIAYTSRRPNGSPAMVRLRLPFVGLIEESADHPSILLFVLFMLSSTAFDGVHETLPWVQVFWKYAYPVLAWAIARPYAFFVGLYYDWQWLMLGLSPFVYLAIYLFFIAVMKFLTGSERSLRDLALQLTYSLIPIALVYHISHYFALLFTDAPRLLPLISDPFAFGWDLFGTAKLLQQPITVPARIVWHAQLGSIVFGHLVSVYLAHAQALRLFPGRRKALLSQFPMLVLMVAFTTAGLWILSLPIGAGQVQDPLPTTSASPSVPVAGSMPAVLPTGPA
jgi:hypothetical protein